MVSKKGLTLIEVLLSVGIIAMLIVMMSIAWSNARLKARDAQRLVHLKDVANALEYFHEKNHYYPTSLPVGQPLLSANGAITYLKAVPSNPQPRSEGACGDQDYLYASDGQQYRLTGCLAKAVSDRSAGAQAITSGGRTVNYGPTNGLIGWWMLDGLNGLQDLSGNNMNGTLLTGGVATATGRFGEANGAYDFLANTSSYAYAYARIKSSSLHDVGDDWTFGVWFYNDFGVTTGTSRTLLTRNGQSDPAFGHWWVIAPYSTATSALFQIHTGTTNLNLIWSGILLNKQWQHLVFRMNKQPAIELFVNGVSKGLKTITGNAYKAVLYKNPIYLGTYNGNTDYAYRLNGSLADFRLYNRALSNEEITAWYNATKP